ncbi:MULTISPECIES: hypothetical protein [Actinomadura]|uniref:hypothetical protein n=1 Tax=Actinomadura TaxID=1988 RepID=UPI00047E974A|nr:MULTISPECIES: hypothetical protein [Actinomadura]RSN63912.1 hypothetical protein DMH08_18940 [Actinomadura sp. WAC 06369]
MLYLLFGVYVAVRSEWAALSRLDDPPTVLLAGAVVVVSHLLGQVAYPSDPSVLGSAVESRDREVALEIHRFRAALIRV